VIAIDTANRRVTLSLINGYSFGKPVFYISTESSDPTVSAIEENTFAPRLRRIETGVDDTTAFLYRLRIRAKMPDRRCRILRNRI
jgi:hypothetical protein